MPELPEVEFNRNEIQRIFLGRRVERVLLPEGFDDIIMKESHSKQHLAEAFEGRVLRDVGRKGKQMYLCMATASSTVCAGPGRDTSEEKDQYVLFHMGMTGALIIQGEPIPSYKSFKVLLERALIENIPSNLSSNLRFVANAPTPIHASHTPAPPHPWLPPS
jgi:formamidopyrimidine-DNA glycosylase